ncbi:MAG TPA: FAD-dependent monooxygenase [Roseiflexaceae bacterium]|nr:FAD-dependent monooxygenase [Roseiflexaceae bacterium]
MSDITVPVLIVGGGGAGLTASMLLSSYGIDTLLVSKYPGTSHLPKAHVLQQKTMEVYRELGVADPIYECGTPPEHMAFTAWYAGAAGPTAEYGRQIARLESWGCGDTDPNWLKGSPCRQANLPQIRLEPLLKAHAEALGPGRIRFNHNFISLEQDSEGVTALIEDRADGHQYTVRARYLLGCDGGRVVGKQVGVEMEGQKELGSNVSIYFSADLSTWLRDPEVLIRWLLNPDIGDPLSGVLVPMGPEHWGPQSEEWVFHLTFPNGDPRASDDAAVMEQMRRVLGIRDFHPQIHLISRWSLEGIVASRLRVGNVFLLGDSAHRHPPTGGLGLNTAVGDAYNLCWKLAAALRGQASDKLLDTYELERKPAGARAVQRSLENFMNHLATAQVLGMTPGKTPEENWAIMRRLWSDEPQAQQARVQFENAIASQAMEFNEQNVEYGYTYNAAIVPDGTPAPQPIDDVHVYEPSTRPGSSVPHAWLQRLGQRKALCDLAGHGRFLLITGEGGEGWLEAAAQIAEERGLALSAISINPFAGDWLDSRFDWLRQREVSSEGAVLVRPDRHIAWRSFGASENPRATLEAVLDQVLMTQA